MTDVDIRNARVESTYLGIEDPGCLTYMITLDYGDSGQGFGGYTLDRWDEQQKRRVGTAFGAEAILLLLTTLGVEQWERLVGTPCRARITSGKVIAIGHYLKDRWLDLSELASAFEEVSND